MVDSGLLVFAFISGLLLGALPLWLLWTREKKRSRCDDLTGLANYRYFLVKLQGCKKQMNHPPHSIGLVLTDIDDFHQYNSLGYQYGDHVLQGFAKRLSDDTRGIAFCARYRLGDEFVMCFNADDQQKIRTVLQGMNNQNYGGEAVKFSYGLKIFSDASLNADQMLSEVQLLLMEGKKNKGTR